MESFQKKNEMVNVSEMCYCWAEEGLAPCDLAWTAVWADTTTVRDRDRTNDVYQSRRKSCDAYATSRSSL